MSIERCGNAHRYHGIRYPRCNGGVPCNSCVARWREEHYRYPNEILRPPHPTRPLAYAASMVSIAAHIMSGYFDYDRIRY